MPDVDLVRSVTPELEGEGDLGTVLEERGFVVRLPDTSICHRLSQVFSDFGVGLEKYVKLYDQFEVWLVPHSVSLTRRTGMAEPVSVGMMIEYLIDDDTTCCVVGLIPTPQFVEHGRFGFSFKGLATGSGELSSPAGDAIQGNGIDSSKSLPLGGSLKMALTSGASIGLTMDCQVATPRIAAVGIGTRSCEWRFDRYEEPLFGKDIEAWSIVVRPNRKKALRYRIKCYAVVRTLFFPTRIESNWVEVSCVLK